MPIIEQPTPQDMRYILDLARKNYYSLGFIPKPRMEEYAQRGQILLESENDETCGYLVFGNGKRVMTVYQAVIDFTARRREHGLKLVERLVKRAVARNLEGILLWCADDLEANEFWRAAGFHWVDQRELDTRRGRKHNRWCFMLPAAGGTLELPPSRSTMKRGPIKHRAA